MRRSHEQHRHPGANRRRGCVGRRRLNVAPSETTAMGASGSQSEHAGNVEAAVSDARRDLDLKHGGGGASRPRPFLERDPLRGVCAKLPRDLRARLGSRGDARAPVGAGASHDLAELRQNADHAFAPRRAPRSCRVCSHARLCDSDGLVWFLLVGCGCGCGGHFISDVRACARPSVRLSTGPCVCVRPRVRACV